MCIGYGGLGLCFCYMYQYGLCVPLRCRCFVIRISSKLLDGCHSTLDAVLSVMR